MNSKEQGFRWINRKPFKDFLQVIYDFLIIYDMEIFSNLLLLIIQNA